MSRKLWAVVLLSQIVGVGLFLYSSRFEVGVGGAREYVWIPAMVILFPGVLLGFAADALDFGNGMPFLAVVVVVNVGFWNAVILLVKRLRRSLKV